MVAARPVRDLMRLCLLPGAAVQTVRRAPGKGVAEPARRSTCSLP
ncbi:hypothetical protein F750_0498 [Streptomyces sp. PAMC 26508]|nr:hypothetical protein F750_0498 [Streptomyces sp. PAMC 26508]